ncbi:MAG: BMP family ABC transporter substrate-binding protein [Anaerolineales bacterium]|nr:BMP family ABC transporter substrate-binding protein [Anaerolineales bacterium]
MRKFVSTLVLVMLLASMAAACTPQAANVEPAPAESGESEAAADMETVEEEVVAEEPAAETEIEAAEEAAETVEPVSVVFLLPQTMSPFEIDMWNGIDQALADGIASEIKMIEMKEPTEFEQTIRQVSEAGYDVVISAFFLVKEPILKVAPDFPDTTYLLVYESVPDPISDYPNVRGIQYDVQEGSYVCGVAAALMSENNHVGFIGGADFPGIVKFLAGYEAGLTSVNPDITLDIAWAGTFVDPDKGHELGLSLFERGDEVVMHAANKTGLGVFIAAEESAGYAVGVDVDQTALAPSNIICSALTNPGASVYSSLLDIATGNFTNGTIDWGIDDGVPAAALNKLLLSEEALTAARAAEEQIVAGEIEVPVSTETR